MFNINNNELEKQIYFLIILNNINNYYYNKI